GRCRLRPSLGHDGPGEDAEILAALAGGDAGGGVARHLLADLLRGPGAAAAASGRVRAWGRRLSRDARADRARLLRAPGSGRRREPASALVVPPPHLRGLAGARCAGAAAPA